MTRIELIAALVLMSASACAADASPTLVGSQQIASREVPVSVVESMLVSVPFQVRVYRADTQTIVLRGEENLIAVIDVTQTSAAHWEIAAPWDLKFEQHDPVEIAIPFRDMVRVEYNGNVERIDGGLP